MKITHNKVGRNLNITDSGKAEKSQGSEKTSKADLGGGLSKTSESVGSDPSAKVQLSSRAQDIKKSREIAMNTPDVDEAKVAKFQKLIDNGNYKVDAKAVADRLVDEHLMTAE